MGAGAAVPRRCTGLLAIFERHPDGGDRQAHVAREKSSAMSSVAAARAQARLHCALFHQLDSSAPPVEPTPLIFGGDFGCKRSLGRTHAQAWLRPTEMPTSRSIRAATVRV